MFNSMYSTKFDVLIEKFVSQLNIRSHQLEHRMAWLGYKLAALRSQKVVDLAALSLHMVVAMVVGLTIDRYQRFSKGMFALCSSVINRVKMMIIITLVTIIIDEYIFFHI